MNICFFGDSHSAGAELADPQTHSFAACLTNKLKASYVNHSEAGSSNTKILRNIEQKLSQWRSHNQFPDLVVVGWTDFDRQDWYVNQDYHTVYSMYINDPNGLDPDRTRFYLEHVKDNIPFIQQMIKFYNNQFYNLHCELQDLSINHIFFNAVQSLGQYKTLCYHHDWANHYVHPYEQKFAYVQWAEAQGFPHITPGKFHFNADVHAQWADMLIDFINQHSLL